LRATDHHYAGGKIGDTEEGSTDSVYVRGREQEADVRLDDSSEPSDAG
jgi:hypothetical protein